MRIFLKRIFFFSLIVAGISLGLAIVNYVILSSIRFDIPSNRKILVMGDSNSQCAVDDSIFTSCKNVSSSGESYLYTFIKLRKILGSNQSLQIVMLSFSPHNIFDNGWMFDKKHMNSFFASYYPLMRSGEWTCLLKGNPRAFMSSFGNITKRSIRNIFYSLKRKKLFSAYGGYHKINRNDLETDKVLLQRGEPLPFFKIPEETVVSKTEELYLGKIISLCESKGVKIVLVNFPKREEILSYPKYGIRQYYAYYDEKLSRIDFLDLSHYSLPDDSYGDLVHLNSKGASVFSYYLQNEGLERIKIKYQRRKQWLSFLSVMHRSGPLRQGAP